MINKFNNSGYVEPFLPEYLKKFIKRWITGGTILDYGCGYGGWTEKLMEMYPDSSIAVFDIDGLAMESTKNRLNIYSEYSENKKYDAIFLNFVIDVIVTHSEVIQILETINNLLNPGGRVIIMYTPYEILSLRWIFYRLRSLNVKGWHDKYRFQRVYYNSNQFIKIVESCGFKIVGMIRPRFCHIFGDNLNKYLQILPIFLHSLVVLSAEKK